MKLNTQGLREVKLWEKAGYALPQFDREKVTEATKENPFWVHFGAGNLFRAFQANVVQKLLNEGILDRGLVVAEGYDYEIVEKMNHPHDDYSILVTLKADGTVEKTVVGSVVESLTVDSGNEADFGRLKEIFYQRFSADGDIHHHRKRLQPDRRKGDTSSGGGSRLCGRTGKTKELYW